MSNVQDISFKLMKSSKELASWNFPLSEILEKYFSVLPEPCDIHYGEAALVIQNSVNAYVRKVEDLYDETKCLSKRMFTSGGDDRNKYKNKKSRNVFIDFDQFEFIKFNEDVGQHINLKNCRGKPLKFFHRCFSELENSCVKLSTNISDEKNDTVGKKHDFRCNQKMTKNGMLAEEVSSGCFEESLLCKNLEKALSKQIAESKTLKYFNRETELRPFKDNITHNSFENVEQNSTAPLLTLSDKKEYDASIKLVDGRDCFSPNDLFENTYNYYDDSISSNIEKSQISDYCHADTSIINDKNKTIISNSYKKKFSISNEIKEIKEKYVELIGGNYFHGNTIFNSDDLTDDRKNTDSTKIIKNKEIILRRSKRNEQKEKTIFTEDDDNRIKPIPFLDGVPTKSNAFRKNSYAKISRRVRRQRKKKTNNVINNFFDDMVSFDDNPNILFEFKNTSPSPKLQEFKMKKECDGDSILNILNISNAKKCFTVNYKPVMTITMDLVEFDQHYDKKLDDFKSLKNISLHSNMSYVSILSSVSGNSTTINSFPKDHLELDHKREKYESIYIKSCHFDTIIKNKIKQICEELDLLTEDDHKVAKWHEEIKLRLLEAEHKPPFRMYEYESRIITKLEKCNCKINFEKLIEKEKPCEIARLFTATLQLASTNTLNIFPNEDISEGIEVTLIDQK